jgi:microsomal dipeptidase-like Zn-dependent dipeptidase
VVRKLGLLLAALMVGAVGYALFLAAPRVDRSTNRVVPAGLRPPSAEAIRLHGTLAVVDLHSDLLLWPRPILERATTGHTDLPRLVEGRVAIQVFSSVTQTPRGLNYQRNDSTTDNIGILAIISRWPLRTWRSRVERALYHAEKLNGAAAASGGRLVVIRTSADLSRFLAERARQPDRLAALLSIEGLHASEGRIENLDRLYQAGFRMMGLTHFFDNEVGGSSAGVEKGGLTPFGREAVRWMQRRRVIIDLAHTSERTIDDVLATATGPVVVSHTGVRGTCPGPRNLTDDHVRRIGATGGVIGIGFWAAAVCGTAPDSIARAIRYAASLAGIEHVGLGSDFDGSTTTAFDASGLVYLTDALLRAGFTDEEIRRVMGANALRLLMESLPAT